MKVLIVSPYRTVAPHFETELEIAQRHIDLGDKVEFLYCGGQLGTCEFNVEKDPKVCDECVLRRRHGFQQLTKRVRQDDSFSEKAGSNLSDAPNREVAACVSAEDLKAIHVDNFDIGYAALSSAVSQTRDPDLVPSEHSQKINTLVESSYQVYQTLRSRFRKNRPDMVYVFNGRFAAMRAVLRACQAEGVDCRIHERGCTFRHYQIWENYLPHDIDYQRERMQLHWENAESLGDRETKAAEWFKGRVQRVETNWVSFVKGQEEGCLPEGWDSQRKNIVIFTTSEDEFVAIDDCWDGHLYPNQSEAILSIANEFLNKDPNVMITVRMHPNVAGVDNARNDQMKRLSLANLRIVAPETKVDSYHLMQQADTVVTFGSTIGIEAVFWNKPSVLLGPCFYRHLKGPYCPEHRREVVELLSGDLLPMADHEALIYGYWQSTHGIKYEHFQADDLFSGSFRGTPVYPKPPKTLLRQFSKKFHSVRKRLPLKGLRGTA